MVNSEKRVKGLQEHLKRNNGERWVKTNYLSPEHMARRAAIVQGTGLVAEVIAGAVVWGKHMTVGEQRQQKAPVVVCAVVGCATN